MTDKKDPLKGFIVDENLQCSLCFEHVGHKDKGKLFLNEDIKEEKDKYFCNQKHKVAYAKLMEKINNEFYRVERRLKELEKRKISAEVILQKYIPAFPSEVQSNNADEILRLIKLEYGNDAKEVQDE